MIDRLPDIRLDFERLRPIGRREQHGVACSVFTFRDETRLDGRRLFWEAWIAPPAELREGPIFFIDEDPPSSRD